MALSKTVFIDRGNRENARLAFDGAACTMKSERQSVFIFPEGTRSYSSEPDMLPFKKGAFHLAVQAQVPIVPVVVANYSNVLHFKTRTFGSGKIPAKGTASEWKLLQHVPFILRSSSIVLPPIVTTGMTTSDVDGLTIKVRETMMQELEALTEIARGQRIAMSAEEARKHQ